LDESAAVNAAPDVILLQESAAVKTQPAGGITFELWIILAFLAANGVADLKAAKLGFHVGPMPLFLTDIVLLLLLLTSLVRWPSRILFWSSTSTGAGSAGRAVWFLCVIALVHFAFAFSEYKVYAARDLAIFLYSLYFPLTYFAIRRRADAVRLLRCLAYAGAVSASLLLLQIATGIKTGLFKTSYRVVLDHRVAQLRSGDANIFALFSLALLLGYLMLGHRHRMFYAACAIACFLALIAAMVRSGVVAILLAGTATLLCMRPTSRPKVLFLAAALALPIVLAPTMSAHMPGEKLLRGVRISIVSAAKGPSVDPNSEFRIVRWKHVVHLWLEHPLLGIGFGRRLVPVAFENRAEREGRYNAGMPHNSFLTILARSGLLGFALIAYTWLMTLVHLFGTVRRKHRPDDLAAANLLTAMLAYAMLGLFFERPETNATFWIVTAVSRRLVES
jgi:O-antigen ligase